MMRGMEDFIQKQGVIWMPHILRRLANRFMEACDAAFPELGIIVPPRAVSTVHLLYDQGPKSVTEIAGVTGQSHPLINAHIKHLKALGLVTLSRDRQDRRRTIVALTAKGQDQAQRLLDVRPTFVAAYRQLMLETDADIFDALWRIEAALIEKPFAKRLTV